MKKWISMVMCAALISAMMSGCGNTSTRSEDTGSATIEDSTVSTGTTEISEESYHTYLMIYGGDLLVAHTQMLQLIHETSSEDVDIAFLNDMLEYCLDGSDAINNLNEMDYPSSLAKLHARVLEYTQDANAGLKEIANACAGGNGDLSVGLDQLYSGIQGIERCVDGTEDLDADAILYEVDSVEDSSRTTSTSSSTTSTATTGQQNALKQAKKYLSIMAFSYTGLIEQLEYEGYTTEEATYGADNCGADWKEQAAKKARDYIDMMSFSRSGLIEQLEFEGFTAEQAEYGVSAVGY